MKSSITFLLIFLFGCYASARDLKREINLAGEWLFEVGDNMDYADPNYDDTKWDTIEVPGFWEDLGYPGYDGYAWYRIHFQIPQELSEKMLYLRLGRVNDAEMVFVNNVYINHSGDFPPNVRSAFNKQRIYHLPRNTLNFGKTNVIAIRVYDMGNIGGIYDGPVGIYSRIDVVKLEMDLSGTWKFSTGDHKSWAEENYDDSGWQDIDVPALWETQGYRWHDGYAWYRKNFVMKKQLAEGKPILVLGKINDIDQLYFNGVHIGTTGYFPGEQHSYQNSGFVEKERFYYIPRHLIKWNSENSIAVRVYDMGNVGGIYEGPIGITTQKEYINSRRIRASENTNLLNNVFNGKENKTERGYSIMYGIGTTELQMFIFFGLILILPFWKIFSKAGFSGWLSLLIPLPVANIIILFYLAFAKWPELKNNQDNYRDFNDYLK